MYYRKSTNPSAFKKQQLRVHKLTFDLNDRRRDGSDATNFAYLMNKTKPLHALHVLLLFLYIYFPFSTNLRREKIDHFSSFNENVNTQARIGIFFPSLDTVPLNSVPAIFKSGNGECENGNGEWGMENGESLKWGIFKTGNL